MSTQSENEQPSATVTPSHAKAMEGGRAERLEWQSELDSAMSDIDTRLRHPRRRAGDVAEQPQLPTLGQIDLTSELLDEIAWRVSEQMRRTHAAAVTEVPLPLVAPGGQPKAAPVVPVLPAKPDMPPGVMMVIRFRWPLLRWPFRFGRRRDRRNRHIQLGDYGISG